MLALVGKLRYLLRLYAAGADVSRLLRLPCWMDALLNHDRVAYPLHAVLGYSLSGLRARPELAALEWIKAAAHARSERALGRVVLGLAESVQRADERHLERTLSAAMVCPTTHDGRDVLMRRRQITALARAGLRHYARESPGPLARGEVGDNG
jgi:hypothetical protein